MTLGWSMGSKMSPWANVAANVVAVIVVQYASFALTLGGLPSLMPPHQGAMVGAVFGGFAVLVAVPMSFIVLFAVRKRLFGEARPEPGSGMSRHAKICVVAILAATVLANVAWPLTRIHSP